MRSRSTSFSALMLATALLVCPHALVAGAAARAASAQLPAAPRPTTATITGSVWNDRNEGIPGALVRLRNLTTGQLEATVRADGQGQFKFEDLKPGDYVLEYVDDQGHVLAVGHNLTVLPGDTVATFIRLRTKVPWFVGFFGNAAASAVSSAAALGVTAVAPAGQPDSPER
jgi:hypothetical protein